MSVGSVGVAGRTGLYAIAPSAAGATVGPGRRLNDALSR